MITAVVKLQCQKPCKTSGYRVGRARSSAPLQASRREILRKGAKYVRPRDPSWQFQLSGVSSVLDRSVQSNLPMTSTSGAPSGDRDVLCTWRTSWRGHLTAIEEPGEPTGGASRRRVVRLTPRTGRTHQLRVHMASPGLPILGDPLYPNVIDVARTTSRIRCNCWPTASNSMIRSARSGVNLPVHRRSNARQQSKPSTVCCRDAGKPQRRSGTASLATVTAEGGDGTHKDKGAAGAVVLHLRGSRAASRL